MNGIFPITSRDRINYQSGVMMVEAMKYAVQTIDQDYLHGYKLEIQDIFDTEDDDMVYLSTFFFVQLYSVTYLFGHLRRGRIASGCGSGLQHDILT